MYQARLRALERAFDAVNRSLKGVRVLEVGCGTGFYTDYCARQEVSDYVGLDVTSISVTTLRQRYPQFTFFQTDVTRESPHLELTFDVVLVADVLFHIVEDKDFCAAVRNICGWVATEGVLILSDIFPSVSIQTALHVNNRALDEYGQLLTAHGLRVIHIEPILSLIHI